MWLTSLRYIGCALTVVADIAILFVVWPAYKHRGASMTADGPQFGIDAGG
jgi:hypothetical protein